MDVLERVAAALAFSVVATALLTAAARRVLLRLGRVDAPRPDRWHTAPVPRPGGPAIAAALAVGVAVWVPQPWPAQMWGLVIGGAFIFLIGLIDDLAGLANPSKFALLIIGAAIPLLFRISFAPLPDLLGIPLALLWILAITNAVNWLDNMDGLASGVGLITAVALGALSLRVHDSSGAIVAFLLAGACAGFLFFNFSPAKIFMGDSGSGLLGFTLAVLALWGTVRHVTNVALALIVPLMVLSIPIFDSTVVTLARLFNGRRLFQGGKDHPSHRLVILGLSERQAVIWLYTMSLLAAAAALAAAQLGVWTGLVLAGGLGCGLVAVGVVLTRVRVYREGGWPVGDRMVVLWQVMYKRRLLEMLLDLTLICVAYLGAYLLRFEADIPRSIARRMGQSLPLIVGVKIAALYLAGVYRGDWRYIGLLDLVPLVKGITLGSVFAAGVLFMWTRLIDQSRAALVIDWVLTLGLLAGIRVSIRVLQEYFTTLRAGGRRVLIAGAGQGGVLLLHEIRYNPALRYRPVGFVDDDPVKQGAIIRGLSVLGGFRDIPALAAQHRVEEVLVAAPSLQRADLDRIALACGEAGIPMRPMRQVLEPTD